MERTTERPAAHARPRTRRRPSPRGLVLVAAVLALLALVAVVLVKPDAATRRPSLPASAGAVPVPAQGAYFGTHFAKTLPDREGAITGLERSLGRQFAIDHVYYRWDDTFPGDYDRWTTGQGRMLFLNWTSTRLDDSPTRWADIAAGKQDAVIDARAADLKRFGKPLLLGFAHEPGALEGTTGRKAGTTQDYVAAWKHLTERFRQQGVTNVSWVWTLTAYAFKNGQADAYYPGDDVVDWIGVDGYANVPCPGLNAPWRPWRTLFATPVAFATKHGKPLVVAEFGVGEDPAKPERKANWFRDAAKSIAATPQIKAVVSFNSEASCGSYAVSSPDALAGYRDLGAAPDLDAKAPEEDGGS